MSGAVPLLLLYAFMALVTNVAVSFVVEIILRLCFRTLSLYCACAMRYRK